MTIVVEDDDKGSAFFSFDGVMFGQTLVTVLDMKGKKNEMQPARRRLRKKSRYT